MDTLVSLDNFERSAERRKIDLLPGGSSFVTSEHCQGLFQNYWSRITSATIMKPCGRHGGYKVARRLVPLEMWWGGPWDADAFGCQSTGAPQERQNFLFLLIFYLTERNGDMNFSRVLIIQLCFSYCSFMFVCDTILILYSFYAFCCVILTLITSCERCSFSKSKLINVRDRISLTSKMWKYILMK